MSINSVLLLGRLGADPELKYTAKGKALCTFSLATDRSPSEAQPEPQPDWHSIVAWERQAEVCSKFLRRGRQVAVEGRIQRRKYEDDQGKTRYWTDVVAHRVHFLGGREEGGGRVARPDAEAGAPMRPLVRAVPPEAGSAGQGGHDDIPF